MTVLRFVQWICPNHLNAIFSILTIGFDLWSKGRSEQLGRVQLIVMQKVESRMPPLLAIILFKALLYPVIGGTLLS